MKMRVISSSNAQGFTLMEILMAIMVLGITLSIFMISQKPTWSKTAQNNRILVASQIIAKQIEWRRMTIAKKPAVNYAKFILLSDTTIVDNSVTPPVTVVWTISPAYDPNHKVIQNVREVLITASWGAGADETIQVTTCIARDF